jgi:hypothetical protein
MCNGLPIVPREGYRDFEAADGVSAQIIAEFAADKAGAAVCPRIRECHAQCMFIVNRHAHLYPDAERPGATDVDHRECDVTVLCDEPRHFFFETLLIPPGLLKGDKPQ